MRYSELKLAEATKPSMKLKHGSTRGHMAEFILGAAATAKLIAGSQNITANDTKTVMRKGATNLELSTFETNVAKDNVEFINIIKNQANKDDATDVENLIEQMSSEIDGSTTWANQDQGMKKLSKYFETNEKPDKLRVKSAGEEGQKASKVDVDVIYIKPDGSERVIRPISLKAGSNLLGQGSPRTFETFAAFVKDLGVELKPVPDYQEDVEKHVISILKQISADFNRDLSGDDLAAKERAVQDVYKFLDKHAGLNDKKLLIVQIEGPNFSAKKITKIREALKSVDLDASFKESGRPAVLIHEAGNPKALLFQIRYTYSPPRASSKDPNKIRPERHRMYVESGPLFERLATVATSKSKEPAKPQQPKPTSEPAKAPEPEAELPTG